MEAILCSEGLFPSADAAYVGCFSDRRFDLAGGGDAGLMAVLMPSSSFAGRLACLGALDCFLQLRRDGWRRAGFCWWTICRRDLVAAEGVSSHLRCV